MNKGATLRDGAVKVAVAGSFGFMDIGDEAMLSEDLNYMREVLNIPRENIFLFGAMPDYLAEYHLHPQQNCLSSDMLVTDVETPRQPGEGRRSIRRRIKASLRRRRQPPAVPAHQEIVLNQCDVALITGGGTINTREGRRWSLERIHRIVSKFRQHDLPVFMSGQTIGPLGAAAADDRLAREIVESVDVLTVRDADYSRRYLGLIGASPRELIETFDDAYCLPYLDAEIPADIQETLSVKRVAAVNVTDYTADQPAKREFIARLVERLLEEGLVEHVICVSHTPLDLQHLWMVRDMVRNDLKPQFTVPDTRLWRDTSLKRLISQCCVAIGGRYHFIVFAGTSNTPFVGMTGNHYSYIKQDGFARPLGLEDFILTEKETWDLATVVQRTKRATELTLSLAERFTRPSVSMARFGLWLSNDLGLCPSPQSADPAGKES